jgi:GNAT superfamily N-acetyltransferase
MSRPSHRFAELTPDRLADLGRFSAAHGRFRYCSCRWRLPSTRFRDCPDRAELLDDLVRSEQPTAVLAYRDGEVVGWCSVAPRESYAAILASRTIPTIAGAEVWSVVCFFLSPAERRRGLLRPLLEAACEYARRSSAATVESYPWPGGASYRYMGTRELYLDAGFEDVAVPDGRRPVMRRTL